MFFCVFFYFCKHYIFSSNYMIKFRDISTADKDIIQRFTLYGERQNCDLSFRQPHKLGDFFITVCHCRGLPRISFLLRSSSCVWCLCLCLKEQEDGTYNVIPCDECSVNVIRAIRNDSIMMGDIFYCSVYATICAIL